MTAGMRKCRPLFFIPLIIGGVVLALVMAFLFGFFVMLLWNWLMPEIFGLAAISYWQAWGLVLLAHILFKMGVYRHPDHERRPRSEREWKDRFREHMKRKFGGPEERPEAPGEEKPAPGSD
jgi:high-affinity Fe2+/Pb2+ permease